MAQSTTSQVLISETIYGVPSGNYDGSSIDFHGDRVPAADYYRVAGVQTVRFDINDFQGGIHVQATLDDDPADVDSNWFTVYTAPADSTATTAFYTADIVGNFSWMRVKITDFTGGVINAITLIY